MFFSPLEQFEILPVFGVGNLSITNSSLMMFIVFGLIFFIFYVTFLPNTNGVIIPNRWQQILEQFSSFVFTMLNDILGSKSKEFLPFVFSLFLFIFGCNVIGLIPYSFTVTSHLVITITFAFGIWIGKLLIGIRIHGIKILNLFYPQGTPFPMLFFIIPLELLTFFMTIVSLSVRLFANMMTGHILLNVFAGFAWSMLLAGGILWLLHFVPLLILFCLMFLETMVAVIQAYVFALLTCMYLKDVLDGGHL
jgi:F-type H+-transporting ATPase subunit a